MTRDDPVVGVDEAGRGPVLGPLVVAAVRGSREAFSEMDVADSKDLAAGERERLDRQIRAVAEAVVVEALDPGTVDEAVRGQGLNELELDAFARVCEEAGARRVSADACGPDADVFAEALRRRLPPGTEVAAAHEADAADPAVSAASIVAKVARDEAVEALAEEVGADVGSGYPSDPTTRAFLEGWVEETGELPPGTRRTWSTAEELVPPETTLDAFAEGSP